MKSGHVVVDYCAVLSALAEGKGLPPVRGVLLERDVADLVPTSDPTRRSVTSSAGRRPALWAALRRATPVPTFPDTAVEAMIVSTEGVRETMTAAYSEEFRRRAVELARLREKPIARVAKDQRSCGRRVSQHRRGDPYRLTADLRSTAGWSAGRSPITCGPNCSPTLSTWPDYAANPSARSCTPTAEPSTSWLFGHRLREAGLLASMGQVASAFDNAMIESFFGSLQIEPVRRHSALDYCSPIDYERHHTTTNTAA